MKTEHLLIICIFIFVIANSAATKERDRKTHLYLQEIKTHLQLKNKE